MLYGWIGVLLDMIELELRNLAAVKERLAQQELELQV